MLGMLFAAATWLSQPTLRTAHVGFYAVDLSSGATLADVRSGESFVPASTMKLLVASVASDELPPDFAFVTTLESAAERSGTGLRGPLVLRGGGDATLDDRTLDDAARAIAAAGITSASGLIGDTSRYDGPRLPPGWVIDDLPYDYSAPVTALAFEDNAVALHVHAMQTGVRPRVTPNELPDIEVRNLAMTAPGDDTIDLARDTLQPSTIAITGTLPPGATDDEEDAALPDPPTYALARATQAFARAGVTFTAPPRVDVTAPSTVLWTHRSVAFPQLLARFLQPSNNLMGELFLNELGARASRGTGTTADRGIATERAWLQRQGIDARDLDIRDGSGLSIYDRMTPRALVAILRHDWASAHRAMLLDALPRAGDRGTLAHTFAGTPLAHILYAKTGSMSHVRALAGYLVRAQGPVAFALLVDDWSDAGDGAAARLDAARAQALESLQ